MRSTPHRVPSSFQTHSRRRQPPHRPCTDESRYGPGSAGSRTGSSSQLATLGRGVVELLRPVLLAADRRRDGARGGRRLALRFELANELVESCVHQSSPPPKRSCTLA